MNYIIKFIQIGDINKKEKIMYNFFVNEDCITSEKITISDNENFHHIANVLRLKSGEKILINILEKKECYKCEIIEINSCNIFCKIIKREENGEPNIDITLFQGMPKSDKMDLIIQKTVELGVKSIIPVYTKNCVYKLKDEQGKNNRWNKISESAAKQSKRGIIPIVKNTIEFETLINEVKKFDLFIVAYEDEEKNTIKNVLKENKNVNNIGILIGPEGGLTNKEVNYLKNAGAKIVTLGKTILRTETAPISTISMIMYEFEL